MKHLILVLMLIMCGCTTVKRPDLPQRKGYEAVQDRFFGIFPMAPRYVTKPTQASKTKKALQAPAKWTLSICLPLALIAFAASLVIQNPSISSKLAVVALICFLAAFLAGVWLLMTMWLIGFAVLAVIFGAWVYYKMHGKGFVLHRKDS